MTQEVSNNIFLNQLFAIWSADVALVMLFIVNLLFLLLSAIKNL